MKFARAHYRNALLVGEVKQRLLAKLFEQYAVDAASSFAYSDHPTDAPMLRSVGESGCRSTQRHNQQHNHHVATRPNTPSMLTAWSCVRMVQGTQSRLIRLGKCAGWLLWRGGMC